MNTVNASTGFAPFQLLQGRRPCLVPPLFDSTVADVARDFPAEAAEAKRVISAIEQDSLEAQDNLHLAKTEQARHADAHRAEEPKLKEGDKVLLSTLYRRREYLQRGDKRVAKFMVRYDGPYKITRAHPETSSYTLLLPDSLHIFPTFHVSLLKPYKRNDGNLFPGRVHPQPGPIVNEDGQEVWTVEKIVDRRKWGRGHQYLVRWAGYGQEADSWLPASEVEDLAAFDTWLKVNDPERYAREQLEEQQKLSLHDAGKVLTAQVSMDDVSRSEAPAGGPAYYMLDPRALLCDPAPSVPESRASPGDPARLDRAREGWVSSEVERV